MYIFPAWKDYFLAYVCMNTLFLMIVRISMGLHPC